MGRPTDEELVAASREVAGELRSMGQDPPRSVLLALLADALGSEAHAAAALPRLEKTLIEWRAWRPPRAEPKRAVVSRSASTTDYRTAPTGTIRRIGLRRRGALGTAAMALPLLPILVYLGLAVRRGDVVPIALFVAALLASVIIGGWKWRRRRGLVIGLDDRTLRGPEAEIPRAHIRYVTSNGGEVWVGLRGESSRVLVSGIRREDAMAIVARLEEELGLLDDRAVRARVEIDDDDAASGEVGASPEVEDEAPPEPRRRGRSRAR